MKFTQEQSIAFGRMINFIESNDQRRVFILKGYAGTGKTTLIKELYKHYLVEKYLDANKSKYENSKIDITATTGRASQILSNKILRDGRIYSLLKPLYTHFDGSEGDIEIEYDVFTSKNVKLSKLVKTVHSLLYRYEDISKDVEYIGINEFARKTLLIYSPVKSEESGVVVVDEASMLSEDTSNSDSFALFGSGNLLRDLFESMPNKKFIFVGDPLQLPPVGSDFSPALSASHLARRYQLKVEEYELRKIIRQSENSGILFAGKLLRWQAEHPRHSKRVVFYIKGINDLNFKSEGTFLDNYVQSAKKYLEEDKKSGLKEFIKNHIYIVLSNQKAYHNNNYFRYSIFGVNKMKVLNVGDILQVTQNNYHHQLFNGDFIQVLKIKERERFCKLNFVKLDIQNIYDEGQSVVQDVLLVESILESGKNNISHSSQNYLIRNALLKIKYSNKKEREEIVMVDELWKKAWNDITKDFFQAIDNCNNVLVENSLKELKSNTINTISKIMDNISDYLIVGSNNNYQLTKKVTEQERPVLMHLMNKWSSYLQSVSKNEIQSKEELKRKLSYSSVIRSTIKLLLSNDKYLNALRSVYGYVITCHKAQGGEWDKVYVQADESLQKVTAPYKWLYTAVTRARKEVDICDFWHFEDKDELLDKLTDMI